MKSREPMVMPSTSYKWFGLVLLMLIGLTNYMDRLSISILQVPIKADLGLTDTQLGAITGLSFSLVYTLAAIPIARMSDRRSPKLVIIICLMAWNALTMLCGLAESFLALAILRMGVAIGEAGCAPTSQALIAGYFPPHQRGRAIAMWQMVFPLGSLIGIFGSGVLSAALGWRQTFFVLGGVGLLVVPLVLAFLKEPPRAEPPQAAGAPIEPGDGTMKVLRALLTLRGYRLLLAAGFMAAIPLNAVLNWNAPFYGRSYSLPIQEVSYVVALTAGVGGILGMIGGGFVSDILGRRDQRWYCWFPAIAVGVAPAFAMAQFLLAPSLSLSLLAGVICAILLNCWMPPQAALGQFVVNPADRALSAACIVVTAGLGAAAGPFLTGILSDMIAGWTLDSDNALAIALTLVSLTALPASLLFVLSSVYLREDIARAQAHQMYAG